MQETSQKINTIPDITKNDCPKNNYSETMTRKQLAINITCSVYAKSHQTSTINICTKLLAFYVFEFYMHTKEEGEKDNG